MSDICLSAEAYVIKKLLFEEFCNRCINEVERIPQSSIKMELKLLMQGYTRKEIIEKSLQAYGTAMLCSSIEQCIELANQIAPEHLELMVEQARDYLDQVRNAGSVFLG